MDLNEQAAHNDRLRRLTTPLLVATAAQAMVGTYLAIISCDSCLLGYKRGLLEAPDRNRNRIKNRDQGHQGPQVVEDLSSTWTCALLADLHQRTRHGGLHFL